MTIYERLILLSEWVTFIIFNREDMTLSALAQEVARKQKRKSCFYSWCVDTLFWYDPNHCRNAYAYYRSKRRKGNRS